MRRTRFAVMASCAAIALSFIAAFADEMPTLVDTWGTFGSGPGQFYYPGGVAVGGGFVYIADQGNNRVQKFTTGGDFVMQWGQEGEGPGDLFHPARIHLANGQVYVVEHQNHRVSRFTTEGVFLGMFGERGSAFGDFGHPVGIASDGAGNLYVVEATNHRVQKFTATGGFLQSWGGHGSLPGQLRTPYGVEFSPDGFVWTGEYDGDRVQKFTTAGAFVSTFGTEGSGPGQFQAVEGIAFDGDGNLYVVDAGNDRVQKFTPNGVYLGEFPVPHASEGEGRPIPSDIARDVDGSLYVVAFGTGRIHKYAFAGANRPPDCDHAVTTTPVIWPPNHQLERITIAGITDPDGDPVSVRVTSITQDEPLAGPSGAAVFEAVTHDPGAPVRRVPGDPEAGETLDGAPPVQGDAHRDCADGVIDADGNAWVRAERSPQGQGGDGRVYRITFEATDDEGGRCVGSVDVCVPTHRRGECVDGGATFNSLGPCDAEAAVALKSPEAALGVANRVGNRISIEYQLPSVAEVQLGVFDLAGRRVAKIEGGVRGAGAHRVEWNAVGVARGVYFCRLVTGTTTKTRAIVVR